MSQTKLHFRNINGFVMMKIEGNLKASTLYYLSMLAQCGPERGIKAVIVEISGDFIISDDVKRLKSNALDCTSTGLTIAIIGPRHNASELRKILEKQIS